MHGDITDSAAHELSAAIHARRLSCRELMQATLARNADVDAVLKRLEWQRGPDRWAMIAATDFLARSFTWKLPGAGAARGLGMALLQAVGPARSALARRMMYGSR